MAQSTSPALAKLDHWVATHVWHPRLFPFFVYISIFAAIQWLVMPYAPRLYPLLYVIQCGLVLALLWRYRKLTPELTLSFHWLAVPVGVAVAAAWIGLGWAMAGQWPQRFDALMQGHLLGAIGDKAATLDFRLPRNMGFSVGWIAMVLRLLGMSIVVPMFEELFIRSLMLRSLSDARQTWVGVQQLLCDIPGFGDWFMHTRVGEHASKQPPVFTPMFNQTPTGRLTVFGVGASTFVFMLSHVMRDWPGVWFCGIAYCLLLGIATRNGRLSQRGLGSVIWAHGITNALIWVYTVYSGDWQFL